jgi:hypothetical protein
MQFDAEAHGIPAAGRSLTQVEVAAGTSTVTVLDGSVLDGDIGKQISIPGAADMSATLAGFPQSRRIEHAAIQAGHNDLTFTLPAGVGSFRANIHDGWRIVVEGAGPGGGPLITTVDHVVQPTSDLRLEADAAVGVPDTTAFLNPPDEVLLDDHARATVGPLTVQLGDRTIADGFMTVGSKKLTSASAGFSAADLTQTVVIRGAGHLVTSITGTSPDGAVSIAQPAARTVHDGIAEVWDPSADALPGFLELLDLIRTTGTGPAEIVFAPGVYDFSRTPQQPGSMPAAIGLEGLTGLTLRGAGPGVTFLRLMPEQDLRHPDTGTVMDTHVVMARDCTQLSIRDLSVHAAYLSMRRSVEQMHGIVIAAGCQDTLIADVGVVHSAGDAVRMLGEPASPVRGVHVERCQLIRAKRSGIAVQRSVRTAWIRDCRIEMSPPSTGSCLDFEPSGNGAPEDFVIESNSLLHATAAKAVSLSGTGAGPPTRRIRFSGNVLDGGGVGGVNGREVTITGNVVTAGDDHGMTLDGFDDLTISDNRISVPAPERTGIALVRRPNVASTRVRIIGNQLDVSGAGIDISSGGDHLDVSANRIQATGAAVGIRLRLVGAAVHRDIRITHNSVTDFGQAGIRLTADLPPSTSSNPLPTVTVSGVDISGNYLHVDTPAPAPSLAGISLEGPAIQPNWLEQVFVSGNLIGESIPRKLDRGVLTIAIGGNPGAATIYQGVSSPVGAVVAPPGSLFIQTPGGTELTRTFVKVSGTDANGWLQVTIP